MQITIDRIRRLLFDPGSEYQRWNKKGSHAAYDRFLGMIFDFLDEDPATQKAFRQILDTESSHDNLCRGSLRSDGYYPVKAVNEAICNDLLANRAAPDRARTIQSIRDGYEALLSDPLTAEAPVFTELLSVESCLGSAALYDHLTALLEEGDCLTVLAWMTVLAVFPPITSVTERKPDYARRILDALFPETPPAAPPSLHRAYETFLEEKLAVDDVLEEVIIVQNHGLRTMIDPRRQDLLRRLFARAARVTILMSEHAVGETFTQHIRDQSGVYMSAYLAPVRMWLDFCRPYAEKLTLHISSIPAIHRYTELRFRDNANTAVFAGFYVYGATPFDQSPFLIAPYGTGYYPTLRTGFEYAWGLSRPYDENALPPADDSAVPSVTRFVEDALAHGAAGVDMAFHAGIEWLMNEPKVAVLTRMLEQHVPLRVLLNDEATVADILPHMRARSKAYVSLTQGIEHWRRFQARWPGLVEVRVAKVPLLHAFCIVKGAQPAARVTYYTYANASMRKNYAQVFPADSPYLALYAEEFGHLWESAVPIADEAP